MTSRSLHIGLILLAAMLFLHVGVLVGGNSSDKPFVKKGWSVVPLPSLGYDSDLGAQFGATVDAYYFGDGSKYPESLHRISGKAYYQTRGSSVFHLQYDTEALIPNTRLTITAGYLTSPLMQFYGFNGYPAPLLPDKGKGFYSIDRNFGRAIVDLQGNIHGNIGWAAGISFFDYKIRRVTASKYKDETTLYDLYVKNGIIREDEKRGGSHIELRAGVVYDSRDHEPDPSRGTYAYVLLYGSPDIINKRGYSYLKLSASVSRYIPIIPGRMTMAYRLSYQGTLAGSTPFYVQQNYNALVMRQINSEILGGGISLRGVEYSRIVANGMAWANLELRVKIIEFNLLKQNWYIAVNPFFDAGMAVQPYRLKDMKSVTENADMIYSGKRESMHLSAGIGGKLVMNHNLVFSVEWGKPFDKRDGKYGLYMSVNYIF